MPHLAHLLLALLPPPPQGLGPDLVHPESGHRYRISDVEVTLDEALELARLAGGTLLVLESAAEEAWVRASFGVERIWLGLEHPRERWANGAAVEHLHWDEGEPSSGDRESFTVMGWQRASGAWNDVSGNGDRFRAVVELAAEAPLLDAVLARPEARSARGALVFLVEGLTQADLEDERNAGLNGLWRAGAWAAAAADPAGDALASWGLLTQGVGRAKTDLVAGGKPPRMVWFPTLLERLEQADPGIGTFWILDDAELSRLLASGGKMDVRVAQRGAARDAALKDALERPLPLCLVVGHTLLRLEPRERAERLRLIDAELRVLCEAFLLRPERAAENWLFALAGTPPFASAVHEAGAKERKPPSSLLVARAPLVLRGRDFPPGPWRGSVGLADLVPTVAEHFGVHPGVAWALDGRALRVRTAELGQNLLENGDAEAQRSWRREPGPIPGWTADGAVQVDVYRAKGIALDVPGPEARGTNHFRGSRSASARMEQRVEVTALAAAIDARKVVAELSGWLGGLLDVEGAVELELACLDEREKELELVRLEPVGRAERRKELGAERGIARTGLLRRSLTLELPKGTRLLRVGLSFRGPARTEGACADELALVLRPR